MSVRKRLAAQFAGLRLVAAVLAVAAAAPASVAAPPVEPGTFSLKGQLLVASPRMSDPHFARTVIFMVEHNKEGALGLVVNRVMGVGPIGRVMEKFGIHSRHATGTLTVHYGGPVDLSLGFVLYTTDYKDGAGRKVTDRYAMTSQPEILLDIAEGKGPRRSLFALGYAGWGPGQLERELSEDAWIVVPPDDALIFDDDFDSKWQRALARRGVDL